MSKGEETKQKQSSSFEDKFYRKEHEKFALTQDEVKNTFEYYATEHLKMSGVYWTIMAMDLIKSIDKVKKDDVIKFVLSCQHDNGGFGGNVDHDPHLLYTLSAVQILAIFEALNKIDVDKVASYVASLQRDDGSFVGDEWGEVDTRFSYCALNCCAIIGKLDKVNVKKATEFVGKCRNFDGGFGAVPGAESHSGQIFCCVAALSIGNAIHLIDSSVLGWWLAERQLPMGGLNGRPEKLQDVCYSWWVLSSLAPMGKISWIDKNKLIEFILECQDPKNGGISDRPGNVADIFHTYFGIAGLSLLGCPTLNEIDPVYALPLSVVKKMKLPIRTTS